MCFEEIKGTKINSVKPLYCFRLYDISYITFDLRLVSFRR